MHYLDASAHLTDFRNYESTTVKFDKHALAAWFVHTPYLVWNEELDLFNKSLTGDVYAFFKQIEPIQNCLQFVISDLPFRPDLTKQDLYKNSVVFFSAFEDTQSLYVEFAPWDDKIALMMALHTAQYFNAVITMGSTGIVDENYLKNFE